MSRKYFSLLLALTIVVSILAALLVPGRTGDDPDAEIGLLFPSADTWINDVSELRIHSSDGIVTLVRGQDQWQVQQLSGFPADWERLRSLLADLARAEVVELKTDNPQYHPRLGVEDLASPGATGIRVELVADGLRHDLILGKGAATRAGQYVRLAESARSLLIDRELDVPRTAVDWALREIVDVPSGDVAEVEIIHPDGDWVLAAREYAADTDFTLRSLPEGREISSSWSVNSLGGVLSALRMDDVTPIDATGTEDRVRFRLLTFAGVEYTIDAWIDDDGSWITAGASVPVVADGAATESSDEWVSGSNPEEAAEAFNRHVSGWQFRIPSYKFEALTRRSESLLQPLDESSAATGE